MGGQGCVVGQDCWVVGGINKQMTIMQETAFLGRLVTVGQVRGQFGGRGKYIWVARIKL